MDLWTGDKIKVRTWTNQLVKGKVIGFGDKDGERVIDYELENGDTYWCYEDQIEGKE